MSTNKSENVQIIPAGDGSGPLAQYEDNSDTLYRFYYLRRGLVQGLYDNLCQVYPIGFERVPLEAKYLIGRARKS